jgi:hypothetical protein
MDNASVQQKSGFWLGIACTSSVQFRKERSMPSLETSSAATAEIWSWDIEERTRSRADDFAPPKGTGEEKPTTPSENEKSRIGIAAVAAIVISV